MDIVTPKTGQNPGFKPYKYVSTEVKHNIYATSQWPHVGVHSSMGHTPGVYNPIYIKEF